MRRWFRWGAALAALAVMAGAFGAHALKERLTPDMLTVWETAARYHMYHALALLAVSYAGSRWPTRLAVTAGWLMVAGIVLFSGSLYAMALTDVRILGAITPFGGLCMIAGWICLALVPRRAD